MQDVRKIYPKVGLKWVPDEDEALKKAYFDFKLQGKQDFEAFLVGLIAQFGRAPGGLKARLARYFDDVPGWDYEYDKKREEERQIYLDSLFTLEQDGLLFQEYQQYLSSQRETYQKFLKRISVKVGAVQTRFISMRLGQLVGDVQKYKRDDVMGVRETPHPRHTPAGVVGASRGVSTPQFDFSGNPEAQEALRIMETMQENLFLTGEAGTGKSTLLQYFRATTKKNIVVLAPTGVAALNVEGQTIHSFCGFKPDITIHTVRKLSGGWASAKLKLIEKLDVIVIDEISMVRADLLDCVDKFLRLNGSSPDEPFGGVQMVFIGDLYQLPPVEKDFIPANGLLHTYESPYFFDSVAFRSASFHHIQLKQIYRQQDPVFIDILNAVRNNVATEEHLEILNQRSAESGQKFTFEQFAIYLTPHNAQARKVNNFFLEKISSSLKVYTGSASGNFEDREPPTDLHLHVKIGAQVMMLNNDAQKRWVNGTVGKVIAIRKNSDLESMPEYEPELEYVPDDTEYNFDVHNHENTSNSDAIIVKLETGETVHVLPHTWEMFRFTLNRRTQKIESKSTGTFTQYPFKLAWAVTIHKAQGKTFNKVYLDLSTGTFAHGQLYVALSRCRTLDGIYLKRPVTQADILLDERVIEFLQGLTGKMP